MRRTGSWRAALAAMAAVAGTGYASGRELALCFVQFGWAGWLGAALAAVAFGLAAAGIARLCVRAGARSFAQMCRRRLGRAGCRAVGALHGLLLALVAAASLLNAGYAGALALPLRHGFLWGMALALAIALAAGAGRGRAAPWLGLMLCVVGAAFYAGLAADARQARLYLTGEVDPKLAGNLPLSALSALCYAALNASVAADAVARHSGGAKPERAGVLCGALMGGLVLLGCAAIARGGPALLAQALPTVPLAARWGLVGFWMCAGFGYFASAATLAAALKGLAGWLARGDVKCSKIQRETR